MRRVFLITLLTLTASLCVADIYEIFEKVSSQALGLFNFATRNEEDFHHCMHTVVQYFLYSKDGSEREVFIYDIEGLKQSSFSFDKKTIIIVHGYTDNRKRNIIVLLRKALVEFLDANVMVFDWHDAATQIYFTAVTNTYHAGKQLGQFLLYLERNGYDLAEAHIIGHSLGAQIAGVAGSETDARLGRITGLDPAGPLFEFFDTRNDSMSLSKDDARFVDVIHSAMGSFGVVKAIGHADFYPNDGLAPQPGCTNIFLAVSCSHIRSVEWFVESLDQTLPKYLSKRCNQWKEYHLLNCSLNDMVPMGYYCPHSARGNFYLQTKEEEPFGLDGKFYKRTLLINVESKFL